MAHASSDLETLRRAAPEATATGRARPVDAPPSRWRARVLAPLAIFGAAALLLAWAGRDALTPALEVRVAPVVVREVDGAGAGAQRSPAPAAPGARAPLVQAPGWIEADPFPTSVAALAPGVVREVLALEGQRVEAGEVVARLVDDDARLALRRAEAEVEERRADLARANADLEAARREWDNPVERKRALAVAEAALLEAEARVGAADAEIAVERAKAAELRDEVERRTDLVDSGAVSRGEFARLGLRLRAQEAEVDAAVVRKRLAAALTTRAAAELDAAREAGALRIEERRALDAAVASADGAAGAVRRAEAARDEAALRLERMEVRAPAGGVVLTRLVEPGSRLAPLQESGGAHVLRLYDPARLQARADIPLADAAKIGVGQPAEVSTEALPGRVFAGRVARLVHEANIQKNTVEVKVAIEEPSEQLRPEMLVRVRFFAMAGDAGDGALLGAGAQAGGAGRLFAPERALFEREDAGASVWVVDRERSAAELRRVRLGAMRLDDWVEVTDGLRIGDRLIIDPPAGIAPGRKVRVVDEPERAHGAGAAKGETR